MRIERCLIDANWGSSTDVVYQFCRQSAHSAVLMPSHGRFVGASSMPVLRIQAEARRPRGAATGGSPTSRASGPCGTCVFDTNYWKSFVHARLAVAMGDRGCLSLFGDNPDAAPPVRRHLTAEYRVKTEGRGRTVDEWKLRAAAVGQPLARLPGRLCGGGVDPGGDPARNRANDPRRSDHGSSFLNFNGADDGYRRQRPEKPGSDDRGLECRGCGCKHFRVVYTRPCRGGRLVRRRECRHCGQENDNVGTAAG